MNYLVILFGAATMAAGVVIVINPETIFSLIRKHYALLGMHVLAVVVRLILGIALILCASASKYPPAIEIIGWITLLAALILGIMGRANFKALMVWALTTPLLFKRMGGLLAAIFGGFLVYAVV